MASVGFRWLDILEKEFDKAFVDLDLSIGKSLKPLPALNFSCYSVLTEQYHDKLCNVSAPNL